MWLTLVENKKTTILLTSEQIKIKVCCWWWNQTKPWCQNSDHLIKNFYTSPNIALPGPSLNSQSVALLNFAQNGFVKVVRWISLSCYIDLSWLIKGFLQVVTSYFSAFAKWNQAEVWPWYFQGGFFNWSALKNVSDYIVNPIKKVVVSSRRNWSYFDTSLPMWLFKYHCINFLEWKI